jgi:hypothetical protein
MINVKFSTLVDFQGYKFTASEHIDDMRTEYIEVDLSWSDRLLSWPWQPQVETKTIQIEKYSPTAVFLKNAEIVVSKVTYDKILDYHFDADEDECYSDRLDK